MGILFKYLDADGGLKMLTNSNLQFTNAAELNDPFDCHPALINFSNVPKEKYGDNSKMEALIQSSKSLNIREKAWICSLSKVYNSLLMWAYYGNHKGVCIGIDMEKADVYLSHILCSNYIGAMKMEVQYRDIIERPDYFIDEIDYFKYQLSTKAKDWEHEQEVRLILMDPSPVFTKMGLPFKPKDPNLTIDWKVVRAYANIGRECFEALYLGIGLDMIQREKIIEAAHNCNPGIKIYQMKQDPKAFRLKEEQIN